MLSSFKSSKTWGWDESIGKSPYWPFGRRLLQSVIPERNPTAMTPPNSAEPPVQAPDNVTFFAPPERLSDEEIAQQVSALQNADNITTLLDAMPDLVMVLNHHRQIIFANRNLREFGSGRGCPNLYGMRPGELLDCKRAAAAHSGCGTGEACSTCGAVQAILAGLSGETVKHECRISTTQAVALDLRIWASPFVWNQAGYVLVIASDISNEKRRKVLERIFFHDLLNTASGISGMTELLAEGITTIDELKSDLVDTVEALINEIKSQQLLLAAENNELIVNPVRLESKSVLEKVAAAFRQHLVAEHKAIAIAPETVDFKLQCDEALLRRVLGNLVKNALEASATGDTVTLGARLENERAVFWCHNPAVIPQEVQLQIFQRSFSTKGAGRGIGTYSIRLLTERYLGGQVAFHSRQNVGTTFQITLPQPG